MLDIEPWLDLEPGSKGVIDVEDWAEIRRLYRAEKQPIKEIVRQLGVSRNTVRGAIRSDAPPEFHREPRPSAVDPFEGEIRRLLAAHHGCRPR